MACVFLRMEIVLSFVENEKGGQAQGGRRQQRKVETVPKTTEDESMVTEITFPCAGLTVGSTQGS